ncbi:MAG: glycosyltransferase family 2 protein, partial [Ignavibacterium sp.]
MTKLPLVSICIPAFNSEKWIKESIKSALDQTWQNKEIIIVDDGSADNTYSIIKSFESEIVKIYRQENKGSCAARNLAFDMSSGDFIQWLDADDILEPQKIEMQMSYALKDNDPLILYCGKFGKFRKDVKKALFTPNALWQDLKPYNWMVLFLGDVLMTQPGAWLISRQLLELTGRWNEALIKNQDGEYIFRLVSKSRFIKFTP